MAMAMLGDAYQQQGQSGGGTTPWGGWNTDNIWDWERINEQAKTGMYGISRDEIANQRDAFIQPYEARFRDAAAAAGGREEENTGLLMQDPRFRSFMQTGQYTAKPQTAAQQWASAPPPATQAAGGGSASASSDALMNLLMERAQQGLALDRNDPTIRAQVDPMVAQMTRASRNDLADLAEQAGGAPVNLRGEQRMAAERLGQQTAAWEGEILGREIGARRDEIAQALQLWGSRLSDEQRMALERELAQMSASERQADRAQTHDEFLRELALREWEAGNMSDLRWAGL